MEPGLAKSAYFSVPASLIKLTSSCLRVWWSFAGHFIVLCPLLFILLPSKYLFFQCHLFFFFFHCPHWSLSRLYWLLGLSPASSLPQLPLHLHPLAMITSLSIRAATSKLAFFLSLQSATLCASWSRFTYNLVATCKSWVAFMPEKPSSFFSFHLMSPWVCPTNVAFAICWFVVSSGSNGVWLYTPFIRTPHRVSDKTC